MLGPVATVTIEGVDFQIHRIDARKQFHMVRRLAPALVGLLPVMTLADRYRESSEDEALSEEAKAEKRSELMATMLSGLPSAAATLAAMKDEDADYVIDVCLDACYRRQNESWARVRSGGVVMFADITMPMMIELAFHAIKGNLGGYFPTEGPKESGAAPRL